MARVPYLEKEQVAPPLREMWEKIENNGHQIVNLYKVLGHSPDLCRSFIRFGNRILFKGTVEPILRELAILQVSHITDAHYERSKHQEIALQVGVPQAQVDAVPNWKGSKLFSEQEQAVLQFAAEITSNVRASDEAFARLRSHFSEEQVVELTVTVAFYNMVSRILETLQVELEEDGKPPV